MTDAPFQLRCSVFDRNPCVPQGVVVEHKRLGAALAVIQAAQAERDRVKLASRTLTIHERERLRAARTRAGVPPIDLSPKAKNRTLVLGRKADTSIWI